MIEHKLGYSPARPSFQGGPPTSLVNLLRQRAEQTPQRVVFTFLTDDGGQTVITDGDLDRRAKAIACELQQFTKPGDRAVLMYPPGLDFLTGFFGCLYAGVLPVPSNYPKPRRPLPRHAAIAADCTATCALTNAQTLNLLKLDADVPVLQHLKWLATDTVPEEIDTSWQPHLPQPDDTAFLQYTSGSTSDPKGVMLTHGNLLHNLEVIRQAFDINRLHQDDLERTSVFWLPAYHDMGLIGGLLGTLYTARHSVLMSPASFLQRPFRWLQAMSDYRATVSGAPNFAYQLCAQRTTPEQRAELDLSHWKLAFCGAEPVRHESLEFFADTFADCGFRRESFYPCYGLAEGSLLVTGVQAGQGWRTERIQRDALAQNRVFSPDPLAEKEDTITIVGCGNTRCGQEVLIVDPVTRQPKHHDEVGEIWVQGDSVASGYWNRDEESQTTFNARLAGEDTGRFLCTGDLGFLRNDELFITGRRKELIIIRGQNHYPQDIEQTVFTSHEALTPHTCAAFSVDTPRGERLVLVQEIDRNQRNVDFNQVLRNLRVAVAVEHELDVYAVALIRHASLPRTSSGKVQRRLTREQFLAGELRILHAWQRSDEDVSGSFPKLNLGTAPWSPTDIQRIASQVEFALLQWLRERAGVPDDALHRERPFAEMGIDSLSAVELSYELETWLHVELSPVMAWNFPTPARMADYLAHKVTGTDESSTEEDDEHDDIDALLAEIESLPESEVHSKLQ